MSALYKTQVISFSQLKLNDLYAILQLRQDVFIIEQQSIYRDIDEQDNVSTHVCVFHQARLIAYTRVRTTKQPSIAKIERVVCLPEYRGQGVGNRLIKEAIKQIRLDPKVTTITLSAQTDASDFYLKFGFHPEGKPYDDGGIEHIDMFLSVGR
ncbi:GCN5-related N-acetyltransferase [Paraglaciecola sp. T6c]|uniref:GNAT family N-acetyltransferase n=1 Tax=Pseudoalteromonas atlantica (strain T6c / ATCC BAA-1087) TaxID=3042615 RepID=UPI00005C671F|nr:GNAT family N-acetyltransferase [Paraglaciecola sp. T6c]ABG40176.1 GCN5-related N-acetyltransferase [Paraglaciecola sp. T6c]